MVAWLNMMAGDVFPAHHYTTITDYAYSINSVKCMCEDLLVQ
jgi:hypothetical protein